MNKIFVDSTAWLAIAGDRNPNHNFARDYFLQILESHSRIYTNIIEINKTIDQLKKEYGTEKATEFNKIIEESVITTNLNLNWLTRRLRKNSIRNFLSIKSDSVTLSHCMIYEDIKRKKINMIFSFDENLKYFEIPLMPQK